MGKKSIDRLGLLVRRGIRERRETLDERIASGQVSLPARVLQKLDSVDAANTDFDVVSPLLDAKDREDRIAAALCIEELANARVVRSPCIRDGSTRRRLRAALDDELPEVQRHVIRALAKVRLLSADDALPLLVQKLHDPADDIQHAALRAIQLYGVDLASQFVKEIAVLLESPVARVQVEACQALTSFGDEASDAIPPLLGCLQRASDARVQSEVLKALMAIDADGIELSRHVDGELRQLLIAELRRLGPSGRPLRRVLTEAWATCEDSSTDGMPGYTKEQLGKLFNRTPRTIDRWIKSRKLPIVRSDGNLLFVDPRVVEQIRDSVTK